MGAEIVGQSYLICQSYDLLIRIQLHGVLYLASLVF